MEWRPKGVLRAFRESADAFVCARAPRVVYVSFKGVSNLPKLFKSFIRQITFQINFEDLRVGILSRLLEFRLSYNFPL